jgi:hypothetical protein
LSTRSPWGPSPSRTLRTYRRELSLRALITEEAIRCGRLHFSYSKAYSPECVEDGFCELRLTAILGSLYPAVCKERLVGSTEEPFAPLLCIEVNATCVSSAWISAVVNGTGRSTRRWKSLVGSSPRRLCGPSRACHNWLAKELATRYPLTLDPNPDATPCNTWQSREHKTLYLCGNCKLVQRPETTDRTLVMRL